MIVFKKIEGSEIIVAEEIIFSLDDKDEYVKEFKTLQKQGVIDKNNKFEDESWKVTLGKKSKMVHFKINEFTFAKYTKERNIELGYDEYNIAYRRYIIELIQNDREVSFIASFGRYVENFLEKTSFLDVKKINKVRLKEIELTYLSAYNNLIEFLKFMEYKIPTEYQELYDNSEIKKHGTRKLPRFSSIFKFIDIVEKFKKNATENELARYYPVVLWHSISFVIPLRPTELLLTKYDCISKEDDRFFIAIRRTSRKGSPNKYRTTSFGLENYYTEEKVEINEYLYNEISNYREFLKKHVPEDKNEFLFSLDLYNLLGKKKKKGFTATNEEVITTEILGHLIDSFYIDIIQNKFKVKIAKRYSEETSELSVETLVPYDSRHLAIINLILMGNEHYTVMKLAGHTLLKTTKGYYDHIEEYADGYSLNYAKYLAGKVSNKTDELDCILDLGETNQTLNRWRRITKDKRKLIKVDGGHCSYHLKDFDPCYAVGGKHSICKYFIEDEIEVIDREIKNVTNKLHSDIKTLRELVNNAGNITRFSEKYSVLTESVQHQMTKKALLSYKKECIEKEGDVCSE